MVQVCLSILLGMKEQRRDRVPRIDRESLAFNYPLLPQRVNYKFLLWPDSGPRFISGDFAGGCDIRVFEWHTFGIVRERNSLVTDAFFISPQTLCLPWIVAGVKTVKWDGFFRTLGKKCFIGSGDKSWRLNNFMNERRVWRDGRNLGFGLEDGSTVTHIFGPRFGVREFSILGHILCQMKGHNKILNTKKVCFELTLRFRNTEGETS